MTGNPIPNEGSTGLRWYNVLAIVAATMLALVFFEYVWSAELKPSLVRAELDKRSIHVIGELFEMIIYGFAILGSIALIVHRKSAVTWRTLGLAPTVPWAIGAAIVIGLAAYTISGLIDGAWSSVLGRDLKSEASPHIAGFKPKWITFAVLLPASVVIAPFLNEILFRGVILGWLSDRLPATSALLLSALIYSIMFMNLDYFPLLFAVGLIFGWIYQRARSIWPCVVAHGTVNLTYNLLWVL